MTPTKNKSVSIILAHINDTHSYFEPSSLQLKLNIENQILQPYVSAGGFARISTRVNQLRQQAQDLNKGFLFLHAGDCFQGTLYFSLFKGRANAELLNALNIDAMALGNHELDMGNEPVGHFLKRIQFPLLAGNWDVSNESTQKPVRVGNADKLHPYNNANQCANWITKEVDGVNIAIFSLALDKMADISNPDQDTPFLNSIEVARATVKAVHEQGIQNIILLSHLGYEADLDLAGKVEGIGVIVGGHSHRLQGDFSSIGLEKDDEYGQKVGQTFVVQAGYHALSMGHCDVTFNAEGMVTHFNGKNELLLGRRLCLDASLSEAYVDNTHAKASEGLRQNPHVVICKKDPVVHDILLNKYIPRVRKLQETIIARSDTPLRHVRIPDQEGPSMLAPLVAESFSFMMNKQGFDVDFSIHNAGGVRASLNPGNITIADIAGKLLPFAVPIGVYEIEGKYLASILEGAINNALNNGVEGTGSGSYPYTHNLRFDYQAEKPLGQRIHSLSVCDNKGNWQSIDDQRIYTGTSSAYTMKGKEGYDAITNMKKYGTVTCFSMADCFIEFLQHHHERIDQVEKAQAAR
ncbi:bifunctional metallophosphatase/5'-nucleotidase [Vibrio rumoiensis]|uniref:Bifunctional metallophosphatase/5'-nucleotidase n=1 Tax=Vibrio rumoiensis 1S-45 TaxID=1188252 RepID=A0A1E5E048_9VIBR|nr:5'-nucleotidase C-terminal domain-containing protein [Vibrio rumoiensis]OEF23260.1 bifunctional metallophosphatase/5'-nucleotidase [Vibrio rumoiensis 1S-45]